MCSYSMTIRPAEALAGQVASLGYATEVVTDMLHTEFQLGAESEYDVVLSETEFKDFSWSRRGPSCGR